MQILKILKIGKELQLTHLLRIGTVSKLCREQMQRYIYNLQFT